MTRLRTKRRQSERGFALLLVFLLAAAVALMLYRQMPRVAFETERDREQLLIDRGEQYKRAIQLFYVANNRFPSTMEDLEKFQDKRYLRRRYKDPMTGKDEWRLVHTNGMFLTDSLVTKPPEATPNGQPGQQQGQQQLAGTNPAQGGAAGTGQEGPQEVNAAVLRRPSDRLQPENQGFGGGFTTPGIPGQDNPDDVPRFDPNAPISLTPANQQLGQNGQQPQFPGQFPGQQPGQPQIPGQFPGQIPGVPGFAFQNPQGPVPAGQNPQNFNQPGFNQPGFNQPGLNQPGFNQPNPNQFGFNPGPNPGQVPPQPNQYRIDPSGRFIPVGEQQPGQPQLGVPNQFPPQQAGSQQFQGGGRGQVQPNGPGNPAINIINQLLTQPRQQPGGAPLPGGITPGATGIAGVASTSKAASIKIYKEKSKYNEWEFVFDLQQQQRQAAAAQAGAAGLNNQNNPLGNPSGPPNPNPLGGPNTPSNGLNPFSPPGFPPAPQPRR